jgi:hypothetical protein
LSNQPAFSFGKYAERMVTPQRKWPLSGSSSPARIRKSVVRARASSPTKAIRSPFATVRLKFASAGAPSTFFARCLISRMTSPHGRSGVKVM